VGKPGGDGGGQVAVLDGARGRGQLARAVVLGGGVKLWRWTGTVVALALAVVGR